MRNLRFYLSAVIALILLLNWFAIAATGFKADTSECRRVLDSQNYKKALIVCTEAAMEGDSVAQFNLSVMYTSGWGVSKNEAEALRWLRASADQRYPPAQYALASSYAAGGDGVPKDVKASLGLLIDAAEQGFLLSQMLLGRAYEAGYDYLGIEQNINIATNWYRQAAAQCDACQYELWRIYYFGLGVDKDPVEAARHLKKAAEGGLPKAQMQLAFRHYSKGEGVPKDDVQAYKWFYIAKKGGDKTAKKSIRLLAKKMSRSQVAEAKAMAKDLIERTVIDTSQLCEFYHQFCGK